MRRRRTTTRIIGRIIAATLVCAASPAAADQADALFVAMKQATATILSRSAQPSLFERLQAGGPAGPIDLFSCGGEASAIGISDGDRFSSVADRLAYVQTLGAFVQEHGLLDVAGGDLAGMEQLALARLRDDLIAGSQDTATARAIDARLHAMEAGLAGRLNNAVRAQHLGGFADPAFAAEGGCGAGEVVYRLAASEPAARLHIIKQFYYMVCKMQGIDPLDRERCIGWQQGSGDLSGAGSYVYVAELPDGRMVSDTYTVSEAAVQAIENKDSPGTTVLTIPLPVQ